MLFRSSDALPARDWLLIGSVLGVGFIATCYAACRWGSLNDEAQFSLLSIAMLAGNVTAWGHYLVCLIFPVATTAVWVFRHGSARRYVFLGLLYGGLNLVGTIECTFFNDHYPLKILANYIPLYAILVWAVWLISRKEADASR